MNKNIFCLLSLCFWLVHMTNGLAVQRSHAIVKRQDADADPDIVAPASTDGVAADSAAPALDPDEASVRDIFYACEAGNLDAVRRLIAANKSVVFATKSNGDTPLHWAARARGKGRGYVELTRELLKAGSVVDARNEDGDTPLLEASFNDNLDRVKLLIDGGANINAPNKYGWTPLYSAISFGNDHGLQGLDIAILLIQKGADMNRRGGDNWTPLHMAIKKLGEDDESEREGYRRLIKLLSRGIDDIDAVNDNDDTALHIAAAEGLLPEVKLLAQEGCALDRRNQAGETPLHKAVVAGHTDVACYLSGIGARGDIPDNEGSDAKLLADRNPEAYECIVANERDIGGEEDGGGVEEEREGEEKEEEEEGEEEEKDGEDSSNEKEGEEEGNKTDNGGSDGGDEEKENEIDGGGRDNSSRNSYSIVLALFTSCLMSAVVLF